MSDEQTLRDLCRSLVEAAFEALAAEHVIPRPIYDPFLRVGHNYPGPSIMSLQSFEKLKARLKADYGDRFGDPRSGDTEFPSTYIFDLLEACVARCAVSQDFSPSSDAVATSIDELITVLGSATYELVCARHVCHLTTITGEELQLGEITVVPEPEIPPYRGIQARIQREIAGGSRAWMGDVPVFHSPPHALLLSRRTTDSKDPHDETRRLSSRIEQFLFLVRLLTGCTTQSQYEVAGTSTLIAPMEPLMTTFEGGMYWRGLLVRRIARLHENHGPMIAFLGELVDAAEVKRDGMVATSFDVALSKFNRSYQQQGSPYDQLVDLSTALEAVLIGSEKDNEGLTLRLRSRVAALLAGDDDPATALFNDVGQLYSLRSKLVHGGQIKESDLRKLLDKISTNPGQSAGTRFETVRPSAALRAAVTLRCFVARVWFRSCFA
jgi:hypothetical protein